MAEQPQPPSEIKFSRTLGLLEATTLGVGAMIGAGIFILSGLAIGEAGPAAAISYLLVGIVTLFTALSYSELSSSVPITGGGFTFVQRGLGGLGAFLTGWTLVFGNMVACALYAIGFGEHFNPLFHIPGAFTIRITALIAAVLLALVNVRGTHESGKTQNILTITKVAMLVVFVLLCIPKLDSANYVPFAPFGAVGILSVMSLVYISFFGFELIANASEEIVEPEKTVPKAIMVTLGVSTFLYIVIILMASGVMGREELAAARAPLAEAAKVAAGKYGSAFLLIAGVFSTLSALNATILTVSRQGYAMARDNLVPKPLRRLHPIHNTPYMAIAAGTVVIILFVLLGQIELVARVANFCLLFALCLVNYAVIGLRAREPNLPRPFRLPFHPVIPTIGILTNVVIICSIIFSEQWFTFVLGAAWLALGAYVYNAYSEPKVVDSKVGQTVFYGRGEKERARKFGVIVPLEHDKNLPGLMTIAGALARKYDGEIVLVNVIEVPSQIDLRDGRALIPQKKQLMERAEIRARREHVPVRTMIRLARTAWQGIRETVEDVKGDVLLMGWKGYSHSRDSLLGRNMDPLVLDPPCDLAVVRLDTVQQAKSIMISVGGGPNLRLAAEIGVAMAESSGAEVSALHVSPTASARRVEEQLAAVLDKLQPKVTVSSTVIRSAKPRHGILAKADDFDAVVLGMHPKGIEGSALLPAIAKSLLRQYGGTVVFVKQKPGPIEAIAKTAKPAPLPAEAGDNAGSEGQAPSTQPSPPDPS